MSDPVKRAFYVCALLIGLGVVAARADDEPRNEKHGWYWYETPAEKEKAVEPTKPERQELPPPARNAELMKMHPEEIERLIKDYHKQAVWRPTPANVEHFLRLQDVARVKSLAMMSVQAYVVQNTPELNVTKDHPMTTAGNNNYLTTRSSTMDTYIATHRDEYGLVFFVQKHCQYCSIQSSILGAFLDKFGLESKVVDINQEPIFAQRFDITFTPQILLVKRNSPDYQRIATGVEPLPQLTESAYRAMRYMSGEIQPEQYFTMEYEKNSTLDPLTKGVSR